MTLSLTQKSAEDPNGKESTRSGRKGKRSSKRSRRK